MMEEVEFLHRDDEQHVDELRQKETHFHQTQHLKKHRHNQLSHQDIRLLCEEDYNLERHTILNEMRVCVCCMDEDSANRHHQKLIKIHN
jgi:hypothetical protein